MCSKPDVKILSHIKLKNAFVYRLIKGSFKSKVMHDLKGLRTTATDNIINLFNYFIMCGAMRHTDVQEALRI